MQAEKKVQKLESKLKLRHKTVEGLISRLNALSLAPPPDAAAAAAAAQAVREEMQAQLDAESLAKEAAQAQVLVEPSHRVAWSSAL